MVGRLTTRRAMGGALVAAVLGFAVAGGGGAARASTTASTSPATAEIVILQPGTSVSDITSAIHVSPTNVYTSVVTGFAAVLTPDQVQALRAMPAVTSIAPDRTFTTSLAVSAGQAGFAGAAKAGNDVPQIVTREAKRIGILASPTAHVGKPGPAVNATIAVLDSGIDPHHPDLNVVGGYNCTSPKHGRWADDNGHGTIVAGVAAARDNGIDIVGVAPGARLYSIKVLDAQLDGTDSSLLCGADWLASHAQSIDVANMSLGGQPDNSKPGERFDTSDCGRAAHDLFHQALCTVRNRGVVLVAGAGNDAEYAALDIPAAYPEVITVSGIVDSDGAPGGHGGPDLCLGEKDDTFASFSNFGRPIDIAAPAVCVSSTYLEPDAVATDSGTSYATPFVSGAAALLRTRYPKLTPAQVEWVLKSTASPGPIPGDPDRAHEGVLNVAGY